MFKPKDYLTELKSEYGVPIGELLVLAPQNDPFNTGSETQIEQAEWFAELWQRFGFSSGVHLRRVHYRLISQAAPPKMHNGLPYENTEGCWGYLNQAGKYARYLNLVSADAFDDRRNPEPKVFVEERRWWTDPEATIEQDLWSLPSISAYSLDVDLSMPGSAIQGYDYESADQPYHLSVWIEKTTMNDVLEPVCRAMGADLCTSAGFQSITSVVSLLQRIERRGKPARILYISDFDPAGDSMPVAVARQVEFWRRVYAPGADVKLTPLALTKEQVLAYRLPRTPIKDTDKRRAGFEDRHGAGAVELDALEALHPGVLGALVRDALSHYRDSRYSAALAEARESAQDLAEQEWQELIAEEERRLAEIRRQAEAIAERYAGQLGRISSALSQDLAPLQEELEALRLVIQAKAAGFDPELPSRPDPTTSANGAESGWLFDAERGYLDQLACYKAHQESEV